MASTKAITKDQIIEAVAQMSVMDVVDLIESFEEKFNVTAAVPVAVAAAPADAASAQAEEQTEFTVQLSEIGPEKIKVIKEIRAITGAGLKEAKEMVEGAPSVVKEGVSKQDAEDIKKKLEDAGAKVIVK